jgi:hypothetical protein
VIIPAGARTVTLTIQAMSDAEIEGIETLTVTIQAGPGYSVGARATTSDEQADLVEIAIPTGTAPQEVISVHSRSFAVSCSTAAAMIQRPEDSLAVPPPSANGAAGMSTRAGREGVDVTIRKQTS